MIVQVSVIVPWSGSGNTNGLKVSQISTAQPPPLCKWSPVWTIHHLNTARLQSWLAINGAPLPVFTLSFSSYALLIQPPFFSSFSPNNIPTIFHFDSQSRSQLESANSSVHGTWLPEIYLTSELKVQTAFLFPAIMLSHFFSVLYVRPARGCLVKHSLMWFCSFHLLLPLGPALQPTHVCSCHKKGLGCRWANSSGSSSCSHTLSNT